MSETVYVWDRFVRFFHWSLAILFAVSYFTGEEEHWLHIYSGYGIVSLVVLRIIWGFIGTRHARFSDFSYAPAKTVDYLKALVSGRKPRRYLGHNPAGGAMVLAMLVMLLGIGFSGLKLYAIEEGKGPLAATSLPGIAHPAYADSQDDAFTGGEREEHGGDEDEAEEFWEEIHEVSVNFMILLIIVHLGGVFLSSRTHGESLVRAMITGRKARL